MSLQLDHSESAAVTLSVLQRYDKHVEGVLARATHVAVYDFDATTQAWQKRNVEGAFFLVRRSVAPVARMMITNRLSPTVFMQDVSASIQFQIKKPYLMYRLKTDGAAGVHGIWFHDEGEQSEVLKAIASVLKGSSADEAAPAKKPDDLTPTVAAFFHAVSGAPAAVTAAASGSAEPRRVAVSADALVSDKLPRGGDKSAVSTSAASGAQQPGPGPFAADSAPSPKQGSGKGASSSGTGGTAAASAGSVKKHRGHAAGPAAASAAGAGVSYSAAAGAIAAQKQPEPGTLIPSPATGLAGTLSAYAASIGDVGILLSRKQLQALLMDLVGNDDEFVGMLHRKYMEAQMRRANTG